MDDLCKETLALTKMDWNNDGPYDRMPVEAYPSASGATECGGDGVRRMV